MSANFGCGNPCSGCDSMAAAIMDPFPIELDFFAGVLFLTGRLRVPLGGEGPISIRDSGLSSRTTM